MPEGIRFEGTFVAGKLGGHTVMTSRDGERYDGQFVADKREGHGVYVWPDGTRYDGQFVAAREVTVRDDAGSRG